LARTFLKRSINPIFICKKNDGDLIDLISEEFTTFILKENKKDNKIISDLEYESWLGWSQEFDAKETLEQIYKNNIENIIGVVIDHYSLDILWEKIIREQLIKFTNNLKLKIIVIDDLFNRKHFSDVLIDQTFTNYISIDNYKNLVPDQCKKLIGSSFCILDELYLSLKKETRIRSEIKKILIYFGSSDKDNFTLKLAKIFSNKRYSKYLFKFVISLENKHYEEILKTVRNCYWITIQKPLKSLAYSILESDIAIGAGGTNTWERLILGLPSLIIPIAKNQHYLCDNLKNIKLCKIKDSNENLEKWIENSLEELGNNIKKISKDSMVLIDGFGTSRICNSILKTSGPIKLKNYNKSDESLLFNLANNFQVRENSFNKESITIKNHTEWFKKCIKNKNTTIYIAYCINNTPIGQIRFDILENNCFIDFSIDMSIRGQGFGYEIVKEGIIKIEEQKLKFKLIIAKVLVTNIASIRIFRKLNFSEKYLENRNVLMFYRKY